MPERDVDLTRRLAATFTARTVEAFIAFCDPNGRGGHSEVEVAMPVAGVAEWRDSLCVSHTAYPHQEDAFEQLGVSKHELERLAP